LEKVNKKAAFLEEKLVSWLRLIRSPHIGPATFHDLIKHYGSAEEALYHLPSLAEKSTTKSFSVYSLDKAYEEIEKHASIGACLLTLDDPAYPGLLSQIEDAPPVLSVLGSSLVLSKQSLAIVGARNASIHGQHFARKLSSELGQHHWIITSGLARGIDTAAHEGALSTGTIAVLASGIDYIYPPENEKLYHVIREKGCIISEAPFGAKPQSHFFPRRNRLISGLSKGIIVVEGALKSGSLITARFGNEQGRDVFAVPGSPLDPRCRGTNQLIQQGATLIQSAQDIIDHYQSFFTSQGLRETTSLYSMPPKKLDFEKDNSDLKKQILEKLSYTPISLDELTRQCETRSEYIQSAIIELELAGQVFRSSRNQITLAIGA